MSEMAAAVPESLATGHRKARRSGNSNSSNGGAVYGLGMIGALVYFFGKAKTGRDRMIAFGKAIVWPALLVHGAFKRLDA